MSLCHYRFRALPLALLAVTAALVVNAPAHAQDGVEVPFITTPDSVTLEMLGAAKVGPGDHVIDLGSGDGRIVITAARRFGATGLGVEIVPELISRSLANARLAGVAARVDFREQDLFQTDLSPASVITMYLLPEVNLRLRPVILSLKPGTRVVSHDWDMGDWLPDSTKVVPVPDKKVGLERSSKVHLWIVPARVAGLWCDKTRGVGLDVAQQYQQVRASFSGGTPLPSVEGRLEGVHLRPAGAAQGQLQIEAAGDALRVTAASGPYAPLQGASFSRAAGRSCT